MHPKANKAAASGAVRVRQSFHVRPALSVGRIARKARRSKIDSASSVSRMSSRAPQSHSAVPIPINTSPRTKHPSGIKRKRGNLPSLQLAPMKLRTASEAPAFPSHRLVSACAYAGRISSICRSMARACRSCSSALISRSWSSSLIALTLAPDKPLQAASEAKSARPSVPPTSGSIRFSGWGIKPSTLNRSLNTPAIELMAPLGLESSPTLPSASQ